MYQNEVEDLRRKDSEGRGLPSSPLSFSGKLEQAHGTVYCGRSGNQNQTPLSRRLEAVISVRFQQRSNDVIHSTKTYKVPGIKLKS